MFVFYFWIVYLLFLNLLSIVASKGQTHMVKFILELGIVDINAKSTKEQNTALMFAAGNRKLDSVVILLNSPYIKVNEQNKHKETALHFAVNANSLPIVAALVERGIDVSIRNSKKKTAIDIARELNLQKIFDYLTHTVIQKE